MDVRTPLKAVFLILAGASVAAPLRAACPGAEHRAFDFWVGRWVVTDSTGAQVGTSEITREADGCALLERWRGAGGTSGTSLNYFDPAGGRWHQEWVGGGGQILHLSGGPAGGAMQLEGRRATPQGEVTDRIRWSLQPDGRVRQEWTSSTDGGRSWRRVFLGFYGPDREEG